MPVREVLARHTSHELFEWKAFELAYGPIDHIHSNELLTEVVELLQTVAYLQGAQMEKNPMPKPKALERVGILLQPVEEEHDYAIERPWEE